MRVSLLALGEADVVDWSLGMERWIVSVCLHSVYLGSTSPTSEKSGLYSQPLH